MCWGQTAPAAGRPKATSNMYSFNNVCLLPFICRRVAHVLEVNGTEHWLKILETEYGGMSECIRWSGEGIRWSGEGMHPPP